MDILRLHRHIDLMSPPEREQVSSALRNLHISNGEQVRRHQDLFWMPVLQSVMKEEQ